MSASSRHVVTSLMVALTWSARDWRRVAVSETSSRIPVVKIPCFSRRARYTGSMRVSSVMGGTGASASGIGRAEEVAIMAGQGRRARPGAPRHAGHDAVACHATILGVRRQCPGIAVSDATSPGRTADPARIRGAWRYGWRNAES